MMSLTPKQKCWPRVSRIAEALVAISLMLCCLLLSRDLLADDTVTKATAPLTFDHQSHADKLPDSDCSLCHSEATSAKPAPTTRGHAPCLASGCHIDDFLSTGPRTKESNPGAFTKAARFCSLCHQNSKGLPPKRFAKAPANTLFENKVGANFHVEMNHQAHSNRTDCSTCHVVDAKTFQLTQARPNHAQCKGCHEAGETPMSDCTACHNSPGYLVHFDKHRKSSDVRVCSADLSQVDANKACFKHERVEHRFGRDKAPLQCSSCHYMFRKKKVNGKKYTTLAEVKAAPMIDNRKDMAHKNCGSSGCHKREVDDSMGTGRCSLCHSKKFMESSLFD